MIIHRKGCRGKDQVKQNLTFVFSSLFISIQGQEVVMALPSHVFGVFTNRFSKVGVWAIISIIPLTQCFLEIVAPFGAELEV